MTTTQTQTIARGTKVVDRDGFRGVVQNVTEWNGSRWYDVRLVSGSRYVGDVVRYDSDLTVEG